MGLQSIEQMRLIDLLGEEVGFSEGNSSNIGIVGLTGDAAQVACFNNRPVLVEKALMISKMYLRQWGSRTACPLIVMDTGTTAAVTSEVSMRTVSFPWKQIPGGADVLIDVAMARSCQRFSGFKRYHAKAPKGTQLRAG
ncbi:uncharacterized protein ATNIH1004_006476 [Aspergillus tanneri]|uniref:Uncharacterized protein n=1 Tax=Aspergillus tanneri TaxID=1220188 RepID=A0A5M9ML86_9EURO|nr:uncharacterized protein ATNIH1004_006476 [Aspergillus tanneri]KAA8647775.1 hypothetical protein ATNIH1004_006476 [Aspergillus tanneri]